MCQLSFSVNNDTLHFGIAFRKIEGVVRVLGIGKFWRRIHVQVTAIAMGSAVFIGCSTLGKTEYEYRSIAEARCGSGCRVIYGDCVTRSDGIVDTIRCNQVWDRCHELLCDVSRMPLPLQIYN